MNNIIRALEEKMVLQYLNGKKNMVKLQKSIIYNHYIFKVNTKEKEITR